MRKFKIIIGAVAFVLIITGALFAYNELRGNVDPELLLAPQPGKITYPDSPDESNTSDENAAQEPEKIKAPDFTVVDFDGNSIKLSDLEGKPVVLNFWASWCPPCKAEMPEFESVYSQLGDEVTFMMVNMTDGNRETKEKGATYVLEQGFSFPVYYDVKKEAAYAYGIRSIPTTIFIDSDGNMVTGAEGQIDEKTLLYGISLIRNEDDEMGEHEIIAEYQKFPPTRHIKG